MSNKIVALMLVTGEEVIGSIVEQVMELGDFIELQKPRVIAIMRNPQGQQGLGLVPWAKSNMETNVKIYKSQMLCEPFEPIQEVVGAYLQETSGLQLASSLPPSSPKNGIVRT